MNDKVSVYSNRLYTRLERIQQIELYLRQVYPQSLTIKDIAEKFNIDKTTVFRISPSFSPSVIQFVSDDDKNKTIRFKYCPENENLKMNFSIEEMMRLLMILRFSLKGTDKHDSTLISVFQKISLALENVSIDVAENIDEIINELSKREINDISKRNTSNINKINWAILKGKQIEVIHFSIKANKDISYVLSPISIEMYLYGKTHHLIAINMKDNSLITLKIERIKETVVLDDKIAKVHIDINALLSNSWGIWYDMKAQDKRTIVLRFSNFVAERVSETYWHSSQKNDLQDDGSLIVTFQLDNVDEVLPWIRGWGCDVVVLEPSSLKERIKKDLKNQMQNYGMNRWLSQNEIPEDDSATMNWL